MVSASAVELGVGALVVVDEDDWVEVGALHDPAWRFLVEARRRRTREGTALRFLPSLPTSTCQMDRLPAPCCVVKSARSARNLSPRLGSSMLGPDVVAVLPTCDTWTVGNASCAAVTEAMRLAMASTSGTNFIVAVAQKGMWCGVLHRVETVKRVVPRSTSGLGGGKTGFLKACPFKQCDSLVERPDPINRSRKEEEEEKSGQRSWT